MRFCRRSPARPCCEGLTSPRSCLDPAALAMAWASSKTMTPANAWRDSSSSPPASQATIWSSLARFLCRAGERSVAQVAKRIPCAWGMSAPLADLAEGDDVRPRARRWRSSPGAWRTMVDDGLYSGKMAAQRGHEDRTRQTARESVVPKLYCRVAGACRTGGERTAESLRRQGAAMGRRIEGRSRRRRGRRWCGGRDGRKIHRRTIWEYRAEEASASVRRLKAAPSRTRSKVVGRFSRRTCRHVGGTRQAGVAGGSTRHLR